MRKTLGGGAVLLCWIKEGRNLSKWPLWVWACGYKHETTNVRVSERSHRRHIVEKQTLATKSHYSLLLSACVTHMWAVGNFSHTQFNSGKMWMMKTWKCLSTWMHFKSIYFLIVYISYTGISLLFCPWGASFIFNGLQWYQNGLEVGQHVNWRGLHVWFNFLPSGNSPTWNLMK